MELIARSDDLRAAAVALGRCGDRLAAAGAAFGRLAQADLPDVGAKAGEATGRAVARAEQVVRTLVDDIERLADALTGVAGLYPAVDEHAVGRR